MAAAERATVGLRGLPWVLAALAFALGPHVPFLPAWVSLLVLAKYGLYPLHHSGTNLDTDWLYRKPGAALLRDLEHERASAWSVMTATIARCADSLTHRVRAYHTPDSQLGRSWPTGTMALWTTILLAAYLILSYV